jgi:hypothetical protein
MKDRFQEVMTNRPANRPVILTKSVSEHMEHYSDIHKLELTGLLRINVNQAFKNGWKKIVNGAKYKFLADSDFIMVSGFNLVSVSTTFTKFAVSGAVSFTG